jgi:methionyl-tRNA formyltransferase
MFELTEAADAGPIIAQEPIEIRTDEDVSDVYTKMVETGKQIIQSMMQDMLSAQIPAKPQDEQLATYWPKRSPSDGLIDWSWGTQRVYDWIRAQTAPYPGAFSFIDDMRITIWGAEIPSQQVMDEVPGTVLFDDNRLEVATFEGSIHLTSVSLNGSTPFPAIGLLERSMISAGDRFERPGAML